MLQTECVKEQETMSKNFESEATNARLHLPSLELSLTSNNLSLSQLSEKSVDLNLSQLSDKSVNIDELSCYSTATKNELSEFSQDTIKGKI